MGVPEPSLSLQWCVNVIESLSGGLVDANPISLPERAPPDCQRVQRWEVRQVSCLPCSREYSHSEPVSFRRQRHRGRRSWRTQFQGCPLAGRQDSLGTQTTTRRRCSRFQCAGTSKNLPQLRTRHRLGIPHLSPLPRLSYRVERVLDPSRAGSPYRITSIGGGKKKGKFPKIFPEF